MRRDVFQAISDPVRRDIIELLADNPMSVNAVADKFDISRPAVSKHIKILQECDLIQVDQKGRERILFIKPKSLIPAFVWIEQYRKMWEDKLDSFESYLNQLVENEKK